MAARRRTRLILGASGSQLPLDRLAERDQPRPISTEPPAPLSDTNPDAAINERRARWLEERTRFERGRTRARNPEAAATDGSG